MKRTAIGRYLLLRREKLDKLFRPGGKVFFGWWIVLASAGLQWLVALTWLQSFGAYAVLLQADFGWSMSVLSIAFALSRLETGLLGPIQGWLVDRYGPRRILVTGFLFLGAGFLAFSQIHSIPSYIVAVILIALGSSLGGFPTLMVAIISWFKVHRSKAIAWSQMGYGVGGLCIPLIVFGLEEQGWRTVAFLSAIAVVALGVPMVWLIRRHPEGMGEHADGISPLEADEVVDEKRTIEPIHRDFTWRQALRTPAFWLLSIGHGLSLLAVSSMIAHLIPHLTTSLDYSLVEAGFAFSIMTSMQMLGVFLGGFLGDYFNKRITIGFCMIGHFIGLIALINATNFYWIVVFAVFHGFGWGIRAPIIVALRADYFGSKSFGTIIGISSLIAMIGMTTGPLLCGILFDIYGNYRLAFGIIAMATLAGAVCLWAATPPKPARS